MGESEWEEKLGGEDLHPTLGTRRPGPRTPAVLTRHTATLPLEPTLRGIQLRASV